MSEPDSPGLPDSSGLIVPVVLCGGNGTRLWPLSRPQRPKPFLDLVGGESLFRQTLSRVSGAAFAPPVVVAGEAHREAIAAQAEGVVGLRTIIEPAARNTAPAIALAAAMLDPDSLMLVCPSDHHIADGEAFGDAVSIGANLASSGHLVTFGITPDRAETGFGYIRRGAPLDSGGFAVSAFVEKPDAKRAEAFLASGDYSWNGGIFLVRAGDLLRELETHRPAMADSVKAAMASRDEHRSVIAPAAEPFAAIEGESIDYAVMEQTDRAAVVQVAMGWSDIGNFPALRAARAQDSEGNVADAGHDLVDCKQVTAVSDGPRISAVGLQGVTIIVDGDEVLVVSDSHAQAVGELPGAKGK